MAGSATRKLESQEGLKLDGKERFGRCCAEVDIRIARRVETAHIDLS